MKVREKDKKSASKSESQGRALSRVIGREREIAQMETMVRLARNVLIEGPVGVGKTFLVQTLLERLGRAFERVDGDTRYTEQKLTGWFDPPLVLKRGYSADTFIEGPLVVAMREGRLLFINELNRMPEAVQNILLPAMDERRVGLPRLGEVRAKPGFAVVATQNPREFTATHALSEALLDRFEMIRLDYQSREEEVTIVAESAPNAESDTVGRAVDLVRATRGYPTIKRGASIRAALALLQLESGGVSFAEAALLALPSRIEMVSSEEDPLAAVRELLGNLPATAEKKKDARLLKVPTGVESKLARVFFPPELEGQSELEAVEGEGQGGVSLELLRRLYFERQREPRDEALDRELVARVLEQAKRIIAHPSRPTRRRLESFARHPFEEVALDESLEENPFLDEPTQLLVEKEEEKPFRCVAMLDASSSMSGEKHLLASIAVAVLLLEVPPEDAGLSVFASHSREIRALGVVESPAVTVLRFLKSPSRGFTNIARGLEAGARQLRRAHGIRRKVGLIATDGRSTEGPDPVEAARAFDSLVVLHLHGPGSHIEASREMASRGGGVCLEVESFAELPRRMYQALRLIARM